MDFWTYVKRNVHQNKTQVKTAPKPAPEIDAIPSFTTSLEDADELQHVLQHLENYKMDSRVAYCLIEGYAPHQWAKEFADSIGKSEEEVRKLFVEISKNESNVSRRNQLMVQLFFKRKSRIQFIYKNIRESKMALANERIYINKEDQHMNPQVLHPHSKKETRLLRC